MSGAGKVRLDDMDSQDLAGLLYEHGVSLTGINSIRENGITGEMFLEFCEDDIKDAFLVFKDRFIVRKLLREFKTPSGASKSQVETVSQPSCSQSSSKHMQSSHTLSSQNLTPSNPLKRPWSMVDAESETRHESHSTTIDLTGSPSSHDNSEKKHSQIHFEANPINMQRFKNVSSVFGNKYQKTSSELMHQVVSSSNEAPLPSKRTHRNSSAIYPNNKNEIPPYHKVKSDTDTALDFTRYNDEYVPENLSQSAQLQSESRSRSDSSTGIYVSEIKSEEEFLNADHPESQLARALDVRRLSGESSETKNSDNRFDSDKHDFMMNLVTSTISQFSPEQLLDKKSVRGRPSEAQRLGTVLIRNAAQSAKIWNSAPLLKDIPYDQKETFMKYVLRSAPQLSSHTELVWTRLREALQNRRKYLLDKECGKRVLKGRSVDNYYSSGQIDLAYTKEISDIINIKQEMPE